MPRSTEPSLVPSLGFDLDRARHFARTRLSEFGNTVADEALTLLWGACAEVERLRVQAARATVPKTLPKRERDADVSVARGIVSEIEGGVPLDRLVIAETITDLADEVERLRGAVVSAELEAARATRDHCAQIAECYAAGAGGRTHGAVEAATNIENIIMGIARVWLAGGARVLEINQPPASKP